MAAPGTTERQSRNRKPFYHSFPLLTHRDIVNGFDLLRQQLRHQKKSTLIGARWAVNRFWNGRSSSQSSRTYCAHCLQCAALQHWALRSMKPAHGYRCWCYVEKTDSGRASRVWKPLAPSRWFRIAPTTFITKRKAKTRWTIDDLRRILSTLSRR